VIAQMWQRVLASRASRPWNICRRNNDLGLPKGDPPDPRRAHHRRTDQPADEQVYWLFEPPISA